MDADALNLLAESPRHGDNWILTPHPGEAARLLSCEATDIASDRFHAVQEIRKRYGGVVVLKGCGTVIATDDGAPMHVCPYGNPAMATAGMGDALTGIIAGLVAQGLPLATAARLGVCAHARAGDIAARGGKRVILATELIGEITAVLAAKEA